jgi:hypothetical protein
VSDDLPQLVEQKDDLVVKLRHEKYAELQSASWPGARGCSTGRRNMRNTLMATAQCWDRTQWRNGANWH